jgi:hypothetical protein
MRKEYDFSKLKAVRNPYANKKKAVGINLSPEVIDYFKELADETGLPYQKLIDLYLLDCAKRRRKLSLKWVAPDNEKVCAGRDLAEALSKTGLPENKARAWRRDLRTARRRIKGLRPTR